MPRKRGPNSLTASERRIVKELLHSGLSDEEIAKQSGANIEAVTTYRQYRTRENARGTALTITRLDFIVWELSSRERLTESQEKFLDTYQSETLAIYQRSWCETERQARAGSLTAIEAMRSREVYPPYYECDEIFGNPDEILS